MRTQLLGDLDIDPQRVERDLQRSSTLLQWTENYSEFSCGRPWKSSMLWSPGGHDGDGVLTHYDTSQRASPTEDGERLPYVNRILQDNFDLSNLLFARLAVMTDNVLVPHRDLLEFDQNSAQPYVAHRFHVPLATTTDCKFMEDNRVYRMPFGGVWSLDARQMHSAAVLSNAQRVHLMLDFAEVPDPLSLVCFDVTPGDGIPATCIVARSTMTDLERDSMLRLAEVIDAHNVPQVIGILTKKHFLKDGGENFVWNTMLAIRDIQPDPALKTEIDRLHRHYTLHRDE